MSTLIFCLSMMKINLSFKVYVHKSTWCRKSDITIFMNTVIIKVNV